MSAKTKCRYKLTLKVAANIDKNAQIECVSLFEKNLGAVNTVGVIEYLNRIYTALH